MGVLPALYGERPSSILRSIMPRPRTGLAFSALAIHDHRPGPPVASPCCAWQPWLAAERSRGTGFILLLFNTSGAVGDLWVAARLVFCPRVTYVRDYGDAIEFFKQT